MKKESYFMYFYMYELEFLLKEKQKDLLNLAYQSDEANTDRPLKEFLKKLIENEFNTLPKKPIANSLIINNNNYSIDSYLTYKVKRVLLKEDITNNIKELIKISKKSIYTNPDICLEIESNGTLFYETIELKTTKKDSIPGSSIQQISPTEWVIFIKHNSKEIDVITGQYINTINSVMQFPDRSPRPQVSFKELTTWNKQHRNIEKKTLIYKTDDSIEDKSALINDWQGVLSERWVNLLFSTNTTKQSEPWFNNNIRKFILEFLKKYDDLDTKDRINFKEKVASLIKKD